VRTKHNFGRSVSSTIWNSQMAHVPSSMKRNALGFKWLKAGAWRMNPYSLSHLRYENKYYGTWHCLSNYRHDLNTKPSSLFG
jgi:hypothetical protein